MMLRIFCMQSVTGLDNSYWDRFWSDPTLTPMDYFSLVTFQDIRDLRDKASGNLTALCFKVQRTCCSLSCLCSSLTPPQHHIYTLTHSHTLTYIQSVHMHTHIYTHSLTHAYKHTHTHTNTSLLQLVERISTAASTACSGDNEQNIGIVK